MIALSQGSVSFSALYGEHHRWLQNWLRQHLGCTDTTADLAQDTFLRILLKDHIPTLENPKAYLSTVARGLMLNHWRRQALERAYLELLSQQPEPTYPSEEAQAMVIETLVELADILNGLPERSKTVFVKARIDGLSYQAIAEQLDITVNMVQKAMSKAMLNCYRVLYG